jgi:hypothetical protein
MVKVAQHISQLLYCHDCVIVPTFGGFVTNYKPAQIDVDNGLALPPSKTISFNRFLLHNDGLLINEISKQEGLSYKESSDVVKQYADDCQALLATKGRLELDKIGVLYYDDKKLKFKSGNENFALSAYGFNPIAFAVKEPVVPPVVEVKEELVSKPISRKSTEQQKENRTAVATPSLPSEKKSSRSLKYVSVALLLIVAFYSAWIPLKTDVIQTGSLEFSDLNPFDYNRCPSVYNPHVEQLTFIPEHSEEIEAIDVLKVEDREFVVVEEYPHVAESTFVKTTVAKTDTSSKNYYLVAGCFKEHSNALKLVAALKEEGYDAEIIDIKNGLHRVSFTKFTSRNDAKSLHEKLKQEGKSSWILKQ